MYNYVAEIETDAKYPFESPTTFKFDYRLCQVQLHRVYDYMESPSTTMTSTPSEK